jgi:hypothetical protein
VNLSQGDRFMVAVRAKRALRRIASNTASTETDRGALADHSAFLHFDCVSLFAAR